MPKTHLTSWQTLESREVFAAPPWVRLWVDRVRRASGKVDEFYRVQLPEYVVMVVYTTDGQVILERQYKHGLQRITMVLPSGLIEPGEDPLSAARRELVEETGYIAREWCSLGSFVVDGNRGCGKAHLFVARGAEPREEPQADEEEELEMVLLSPDDLREALRKGDIALVGSALAVALALNPWFTPSPYPAGEGDNPVAPRR